MTHIRLYSAEILLAKYCFTYAEDNFISVTSLVVDGSFMAYQSFLGHLTPN